MSARVRVSETPYLDEWRGQLRVALDGRGNRTALAEHLARLYGQSLHTARMTVSRILSGAVIPNGETVLAISHWISTRTAGR